MAHYTLASHITEPAFSYIFLYENEFICKIYKGFVKSANLKCLHE